VVPGGFEGPNTEVHLSVSSSVTVVSGLSVGLEALVLNL
jgi:hypothetical protein